MVDSDFLAFLSSSCDENHPLILWLGVARFPEELYIFSNVLSILLVDIQDADLQR